MVNLGLLLKAMLPSDRHPGFLSGFLGQLAVATGGWLTTVANKWVCVVQSHATKLLSNTAVTISGNVIQAFWFNYPKQLHVYRIVTFWLSNRKQVIGIPCSPL